MPTANIAQRLQQSFESFSDPSRDGVAELLADYADDAVFEDPFQRIGGRVAIERAFRSMVRAARSMRIQTSDLVASTDTVWFAWRFELALRRGPTLVVEGATVFRLKGDRVVHHRDYWDTVESLGLSMPGLKALAHRMLRRSP